MKLKKKRFIRFLLIPLSCLALLLSVLLPAEMVEATTQNENFQFSASVRGGYHLARINFTLNGKEYMRDQYPGKVLYQLADEASYSNGNFLSYEIAETSDFTINMADIGVGEKKYVRLVYIPEEVPDDGIYNVMMDNNTGGWEAYFSDYITLVRQSLDLYSFRAWTKFRVNNDGYDGSVFFNIKSNGFISEFYSALHITENKETGPWVEHGGLYTGLLGEPNYPAAKDTDYTTEFYGLGFGEDGTKENTTYYYKLCPLSEPDIILAEGSFTTPALPNKKSSTLTPTPTPEPTEGSEEVPKEIPEDNPEEESEDNDDVSLEEDPYSMTNMDITLSKATYQYTGAEIKPSITVKQEDTILTEGTNYELEYSDNIEPGEALVTVTGIGDYNGVMEITFNIIKEKPKLSVTAEEKKAKLKWSKLENADGYEVYMSTSKTGEFELIKSLGKKTNSYVKAKLKKGATYYFKVRAYRLVDGENVYTEYSAAKACTVK